MRQSIIKELKVHIQNPMLGLIHVWECQASANTKVWLSEDGRLNPRGLALSTRKTKLICNIWAINL